MLSDSLFMFNHSCTSDSSVLIILLSVCMSSSDLGVVMWKWVMVPIRLVLSANNTAWSSRDAFDKSFMYIRKSMGPSTDPCGTPCFKF